MIFLVEKMIVSTIYWFAVEVVEVLFELLMITYIYRKGSVD